MGIEPVKFYLINISDSQVFSCDEANNNDITLTPKLLRGAEGILHQSWLFFKVFGVADTYYIKNDRGYYLGVDGTAVKGRPSPEQWSVKEDPVNSGSYTIQHVSGNYIMTVGSTLSMGTSATNYNIVVSTEHPLLSVNN